MSVVGKLQGRRSCPKGHGTVGAGSEKRRDVSKEGWITCPMKTGWESCGCSSWRREGLESSENLPESEEATEELFGQKM